MKRRGYLLLVVLGLTIGAVIFAGAGGWFKFRESSNEAGLPSLKQPLARAAEKPKKNFEKSSPQPCSVPRKSQALSEEAWKLVDELADPCSGG